MAQSNTRVNRSYNQDERADLRRDISGKELHHLNKHPHQVYSLVDDIDDLLEEDDE